VSTTERLRRKVPVWIWLPLVLALAVGVVLLKQWQLEEGDGHAAFYAEQKALQARARWMDSLVLANATDRQKQLMQRVNDACRATARGDTVHDVVAINDYRDAAKRVTDWSAEVLVRDSTLQLRSVPLVYAYVGPWADVRDRAVAQHGHAVRFSARISFAPDNETCMLEFVVRDLTMTRIVAEAPEMREAHAGH